MRDDSPKFHLRLEREPYPNEKVVFEVLTQNSEIEWSFEAFQQDLHRQDEGKFHPLYIWHFCTEKERGVIEQNFSEIGVQLHVEQLDSTFLFPMGQITNSQNDWFSRQLVLLNEDGLDSWALANHCSEVYRVTLIPSFDPTEVMRIHPENVTYKAGYYGKKLHYENWIPSAKTWTTIQRTIDDMGFWSDSSWYTVPEGFLVLDGSVYIIEGYKHGQYRFLYDQGAAENKAGYVTGEFMKLRPDKP